MAKLELVRYLNDSAEELIEKAESAGPAEAKRLLDEAEELLALGVNILSHDTMEIETKEAA
jgi:hypothetical protein